MDPTEYVGEWSFVQVLSCHEKLAAGLFLREGVQCYVPMYRDKLKESPLFARYVFVCGDSSGDWLDIIRLHTSGGRRIVCMTKTICDQKRFVRELGNIHSDLAAGRIRPYKLPQLGDHCLVTEGVWKGYRGTIERAGEQTLFVLRLYGSATVIEIPPHKLEILDARASA